MVCYAHSAPEHNDELESVLFEQGFSKYQSGEIKDSIIALEYASYLTIDQFGGNGLDKFQKLKDLDIRGLPLRFSVIDYSEDPMGNGKKINANTHRRFTHEGWDREGDGSRSVQKFWDARRRVLLSTVNTIFEFDDKPIIGYGEKCNSFAGIIYYIHILGDYEAADNSAKIQYLTDLAGRSDKKDMISALRAYTETLFFDQKNTVDYSELMDGFDEIERKSGRIVQSIGGVNTDAEFEEYHQCALDLMELLEEHLPTLLKNEKFFSQVFYH